jgi:hypothetical protein
MWRHTMPVGIKLATEGGPPARHFASQYVKLRLIRDTKFCSIAKLNSQITTETCACFPKFRQSLIFLFLSFPQRSKGAHNEKVVQIANVQFRQKLTF